MYFGCQQRRPGLYHGSSCLWRRCFSARLRASGTRSRKRLTIGSSLFRTNCASCHGVDGKGEGPVADQLRFVPTDLTTIARRNGDKFPGDEVRRMIDGRDDVKGHRATDMPIWGDAFKKPEEKYSAKKAPEKIGYVIEYIESIQTRAKRQ